MYTAPPNTNSLVPRFLCILVNILSLLFSLIFFLVAFIGCLIVCKGYFSHFYLEADSAHAKHPFQQVYQGASKSHKRKRRKDAVTKHQEKAEMTWIYNLG